MTTAYFTFGQDHRHEINGIVYDADCVLRITAADPRMVMLGLFGVKWAMEYAHQPNMQFYPRGIIEMPMPDLLKLMKERDCWITTAKNLQAQVNGWEAERAGLKDQIARLRAADTLEAD